jgi:hypothetical protein
VGGAVTYERPAKPPKVDDHYRYWGKAPPERSPRCQYWVDQIKRGWKRNRRIGMMGYDEGSEWFGVYIWEYQNVLMPLMAESTVVQVKL